MKLPFIEALNSLETGRTIQLTPRLSVEASVEDNFRDRALYNRALQVRSSAKFEILQIAYDAREIPVLQRQAQRVLMNEVYGPVRERLFDILTMLWEQGAHYDEKIAKAVDDLMNDMRD